MTAAQSHQARRVGSGRWRETGSVSPEHLFGDLLEGRSAMRVLGVDPGLTRCGLAVVEGGLGGRPALVEAGVVRTHAGAELGSRLVSIDLAVREWLDRLRPDAVAVERVFSQHNVRTVMGTAQAGAVAALAAAQRDLPVATHTPSEVKAAITGNGRADKAQVGAMVARLLSLHTPPRPADAADAAALAICHLWRGAGQQRIAAALQAERARRPATRPATRRGTR